MSQLGGEGLAQNKRITYRDVAPRVRQAAAGGSEQAGAVWENVDAPRLRLAGGGVLTFSRECGLPRTMATPSTSLRVLVVDDHAVFRLGVSALVAGIEGLALCGEAGDAVEAREQTLRLAPDVVVLDLMLAQGDGLTLIRELRGLRPGLAVVAVTMLEGRDYEARARAAGARAFVAKGAGTEALARVLRALTEGGECEAGGGASAAREAGSDVGDLSDRELQVFQLLGLGRGPREIGLALGISPRTADAHRENIRAKLGEPNARALLLRAAAWNREQGIGG